MSKPIKLQRSVTKKHFSENTPKLRPERSPYFTRSVARRSGALNDSESSLLNADQRAPTRNSISRNNLLTSVSFNEVNVSRCSVTPCSSFATPYTSLVPSANFNNFIRRPVLNNLDNAHSNFNDRFRRNNSSSPMARMDLAVSRDGEYFFWIRLLSILILLAVLLPTVWYIFGHFCATEIFYNKVEAHLHELKDGMKRMKHRVEADTNKQLQIIGKDTNQKLAEVEQVLREFKSCPVSGPCPSAEMSYDVLHSADSNAGRPDFALESSGGSIIGIGDDTEPFESGATSKSIFGITTVCSQNCPQAVIQANVQPGECWAFKGSSGSVTIKLLGYVYLSGVSLVHIPKSISPSGHIDSAPKEFSIVGLANEGDTEGTTYGTFKYNNEGPPTQFFAIDGSTQSYGFIRLQIHSNYGNPRFTCVYRLQAHGKLDEDETRQLGAQ